MGDTVNGGAGERSVSSSSDSLPLSKDIEVVFIRHAESEENVKIRALCDVLCDIRRVRVPSSESFSHLAKFLQSHDKDSTVSDLGRRQIRDMSVILKSRNFWKEYKFDRIAVSSMKRAKETLFGVVPSELSLACEVIDELREIGPIEQLIPSRVRRKVRNFESWLISQCQGEGVRRILIVGHCQFFHSLLRMNVLMRNCDVWSASCTMRHSTPVNTDSLSVIQWQNPKLMYRTELSFAHPIGNVLKLWLGIDYQDTDEEDYSSNMSGGTQSSLNSSSSHDVVDDLADVEEPICRICQCRQSESSELRMIRPCLCVGSMAHVHVECLNQWRSTSAEAYYRCYVCKYNYRIQRTAIAKILVDDVTIIAVTVLLMLCTVVLVGIVADCAFRYLQISVDPVEKLLSLMRVDLYMWKRCNAQYHHSRIQIPSLLEIFTTAYRHSRGYVEYISHLSTVLTHLPAMYFLCNPYGITFTRVFVLGAFPIGFVGFVGYFLSQIAELRGENNNRWLTHIGMIVAWMTAIGTPSLSRLALVVGCLISARELYVRLQVVARQFGQRFGDMILEPNAS